MSWIRDLYNIAAANKKPTTKRTTNKNGLAMGPEAAAKKRRGDALDRYRNWLVILPKQFSPTLVSMYLDCSINVANHRIQAMHKHGLITKAKYGTWRQV